MFEMHSKFSQMELCKLWKLEKSLNLARRQVIFTVELLCFAFYIITWGLGCCTLPVMFKLFFFLSYSHLVFNILLLFISIEIEIEIILNIIFMVG
jgi:hypothetical protein